MDSPAVRVLSICSGIGGMELALRLVLGDVRAVCYVERDIAPARVLATRMAGGQIEPAPIWSDVCTFDSAPWVGVVDCVAVSPPCQPFSVAGKRRGTEDERWIWPDIWRCIRVVRPRLIFAENTPGLIRDGLATILDDLAAGGYDVAWDVFSAGETGAPQLRNRVFVLADAGRERQQKRQPAIASRAQHAATECGGGEIGRQLEHPEHGPERVEDPGRVLRYGVAVRGEVLGDGGEFSELEPRHESVRDEQWDQTCRETGWPGDLFPPGYWDEEEWPEWLIRQWAEWLERNPGTEPSIRRGAPRISGRMERLFGLGNAIVPLAGAYAFATLATRLGIDLDLEG